MKTQRLISRAIVRILSCVIVFLDLIIAFLGLEEPAQATPQTDRILITPPPASILIEPQARILITPAPIQKPNRILITPAPIAPTPIAKRTPKQKKADTPTPIAPNPKPMIEWAPAPQPENAALPTIAQMRSFAAKRGLKIPSQIKLKSEVWDYLITTK